MNKLSNEKPHLGFWLLALLCVCNASSLAQTLPLFTSKTYANDWLIAAPSARAQLTRNQAGNELILTNGLIARHIRIAPNAATVAFDNLVTGESLLRAVAPEAWLEIDGQPYAIGGLTGQLNLAYLRREWLDAMKADASAFQFDRYEVGQPETRLTWKRVRPAANADWPPKGVALTLWFKPPASAPLKDIRVAVHYELYDGLPVLSKWVTVQNDGAQTVRLNRFKSELLRVLVEHVTAPSSDQAA